MAYNPGPTNVGSPGNTPIFPRVVQGAEYDIANALPPDANRGVTNCAAAFAAQTEPFRVSAGTWYINTDTTINADMVFSLGAKIKVGAGRTVTINGAIEAWLQQQIFDVSASGARVIGTFGNSPRSPCWWGAVGDWSAAGATGTNNIAAFQACVDACHYSDTGVSSFIVIPPGNFFIEGATRAAIPSGGPVNLCERGILQMYIGDCMVGSSIGSTILTFGAACSGVGYAISYAGIGSSGPPNQIGNFFIGGETGSGAYGITGALGLYGNGAFAFKVWANGFGIGILMDSTSQKVETAVLEYCGDGLRMEAGLTWASGIEAQLCGNGIVIDHGSGGQTGPSYVDNYTVYNRNGGLFGGYGVVVTGTATHAQLTNGFIEAYNGGGAITEALAIFNTIRVQVTNFEGRITGNNFVVRIAGGADIQLSQIVGRFVTGTSSSNAVIKIESGASKVQISEVQADGDFQDGIYIDTAGDRISLSQISMNGMNGWGIRLVRATTFLGSNIQCNGNGSGGIRDEMANGLPQSHTWVGVNADALSTQPFGVQTDIDEVNGRFVLSGGIAVNNTTAGINHAGTYTTTPQINVSNFVTA